MTLVDPGADHDHLVDLVAETAAALVAVVVTIPEDDWERPGLGEWSVRELVGHLLRAFSTIDRFLDTPSAEVAVATPGEYFRVALGSSPTVHAQVAERGRAAGQALGDDPASTVVEGVSAVIGRLSDTTGDEVGTTAVGGMRLTAYLDTRLVELVVHLGDLCEALGIAPPALGDAAVRAATTMFASARPADQHTVLRAMSGRVGLPDGFDVWA